MHKGAFAVLLCIAAPMLAQSPKATELLQQAHKASHAGDSIGALRAYIEAVKIDPTVESLDLIASYEIPIPRAFLKTDPEKKSWREERELTGEALRMYVARHPDEWGAVRALSRTDVKIDRPADAEKLLGGFLARHPGNVGAHRELVDVYTAQSKLTDALTEAERLAQLPSCEPKDAALAGEIAYQLISTRYKETSPARTEMLQRGEAVLARALQRNPENLDALLAMNALLLDRARNETNPERQAALMKQLEEVRGRSRALLERKKALADPRPISRDWGVTILQGGYSESANVTTTMHLQRAPFTIEVSAPAPSPVGLNVLDSDAVARGIHEGFRIPDDCKAIVAFCPGTAFAEDDRNVRRALNVAKDGYHYLNYDSETDNRWSRVKKTIAGYTMARDVAVLDDKPLEATSFCRLFLTIVRRNNDGGVLRADEIIRIVLQFD